MAIKTIGILTSGGDAPGMNAAIRAVTRSAICNGFDVYGIYRGFEGLINGEIEHFTSESVSNIISRGGTILRTARSKSFMSPEGREQAYKQMPDSSVTMLDNQALALYQFINLYTNSLKKDGKML